MTTRPDVLLIHGMWSQPWVWDAWRALLEQAGYRCHAPALPLHDAAPDAPPPEGLGRIGLAEYTDAMLQAAQRITQEAGRAPILMGHSMGGLITQMLATRMKASAVVCVNSASPGQIHQLRPITLPGTVRHFANPLLWRLPFRLNAWEACYLLFNQMSKAEAKAMHERIVHESGRVAYQQAFGPLNLAGSNRVDKDKISAPMLYLSSALDRIIPVAASRASARWYGSMATYREYPQHAHWLLQEKGYEAVVADVLAWLNALKLEA
jgi:pimeloyl-ACP methyl ester carboxylesterase